MKDNFFEFWFRFISRYFSELETWEIEGAWSDFKREFNSYLGFAFEKIAMDFLVEKKPFRFQKKLEEARRTLRELEGKAGFVDWNKRERLERFGRIAKRLEGKEKLKAEGYLCYDLEDIEKEF